MFYRGLLGTEREVWTPFLREVVSASIAMSLLSHEPLSEETLRLEQIRPKKCQIWD